MFLRNPMAASASHALLRVVAGFLFMFHGAQKLFGMFGGVDGEGAAAPLVSLYGLAGTLELFGGLLIVIGLLTRPVAFLLAGEMAVAYFMVHAPQSLWPIQNQGELAVLYAFTWLYFAFNGAGRWSADAARHRDEVVVATPAEHRRRAA